MLLQIDGWFGAGKSVLWSLLDGHPAIFCSPIHDYSYSAFLSQDNDLDWVKSKHIEIVRKILARTQYFKFEKVYWDGFVTFDFSSEHRLKIPINYIFYDFDYKFIKTLTEMKSWSIEKIIDVLYYSINNSNKSKLELAFQETYYASQSNPLFIEDYYKFPFLFPNGKSIQVRRSVASILATRTNRKPVPEDFKTKHFADPLMKRVKEGEIEKILSFYDTYDNLVEKHPSAFMVIDFLDLINNTEEAIKKVAKFIGIPFHPNLLMASYQGKELIYKGKKYVGQEHDDINKLLTKEEQEVIQKSIKNYYKNQNIK